MTFTASDIGKLERILRSLEHRLRAFETRLREAEYRVERLTTSTIAQRVERLEAIAWHWSKMEKP